MKKLLAFIVMLGFLLGSKPLFAGVIFYDDAEDSPKKNEWNIIVQSDGSSISSSSEQARAGNRSYKFVYVPRTSSKPHIELRLLRSDIMHFSYNKEYWIGYSIFFPSDFKYPDNSKNQWAVVGQFHGVSDACETANMRPVMAFIADNKIKGFTQTIAGIEDFCFKGTMTRSANYDSPSIKMGSWNDIVMNFKFNYTNNNNPFFKVWLNGKLIMDDKGPNCFNDAKSPYFKMGIYSNAPNKMIAFYDEFRVGDENSSYDEVAPKGSQIIETNVGLEAPKLRLVPTN